jgi:hypothetical protein
MQVKFEVWAAWLGATAVAAVASTFILLTFAYGQFESKEHSKEKSEQVQTELAAMNVKLDRILSYDLLAPNRSVGGKKSR